MARHKNSCNKVRVLYLISISGLNSPSTVVRAEIFTNSYQNDNLFSAHYYYLFSKKLDKIIFFLKKDKHTKYLSAPFIVINNLVKEIKKIWLLQILDKYSAIIIIKYFDLTLLSKIKFKYNGKILFDFDDAIWLKEFGGYQSFKNLVTKVDYVSCDNTYLLNESRKICNNCFIVNGPVKFNKTYFKYLSDNQTSNKIIIGWIGSPYTLFYLNQIVDVLDELSLIHDNLEFRICGVGTNLTMIPHFKNTKISTLAFYNKDSMINEISKFDIGIYPIDNSELSLGRGSLKATLYMSCSVPVVANAIGHNCNIIQNGENGYLVNTKKEWFNVINNLIMNPKLRIEIGRNGYNFVKNEYSVEYCFLQLKNGFLNHI